MTEKDVKANLERTNGKIRYEVTWPPKGTVPLSDKPLFSPKDTNRIQSRINRFFHPNALNWWGVNVRRALGETTLLDRIRIRLNIKRR